MPNRIIRETICTSDSIDGLSWFEEVLFYRLIVSCDDFGRYDGRTAVIKNRLFPLKENLTLKTVENALHGLASAGLVVLYESQGGRFLYLPTWGKYQQQRAKVSKYPEPSADILHQLDGVSKQTIADDSKCNQVIANVPVIENRESRIDIRESGSENNAREARFSPPSLPEVQAYISERGSAVDAQQFVDFYASKGWMVGKNRMKDWKAAVRTWEKRRKEEAGEHPTKQEYHVGTWL